MPADIAELQVLQSAALLLIERMDEDETRVGLEGDLTIGDTTYRVSVEMKVLGH